MSAVSVHQKLNKPIISSSRFNIFNCCQTLRHICNRNSFFLFLPPKATTELLYHRYADFEKGYSNERMTIFKSGKSVLIERTNDCWAGRQVLSSSLAGKPG